MSPGASPGETANGVMNIGVQGAPSSSCSSLPCPFQAGAGRAAGPQKSGHIPKAQVQKVPGYITLCVCVCVCVCARECV